MLDVLDFITDRGGNPEKVRESQRRRHAPVEIVDEIITLFDDHRKSESVHIQRCGTRLTHSSQIRGQPNQHEDQCNTEGDWCSKEGQNLISALTSS
jgi:hypothetical protein